MMVRVMMEDIPRLLKSLSNFGHR